MGVHDESSSSRGGRNHRRHMALWVAEHILPREDAVRAWLRRRTSAEDVDEILQDAYCRIAMLEDVDHIDRPDAYFFSIVRNLLVRRLKRQRVVPFEVIADIDAYLDDQPSPEKQAADKSDYARMLELMAGLPERCRRIVHLRKIEGWSQKRIAEHLGTTEKAVEKQIWLGVRAIRSGWSDDEDAADARFQGLVRDGKTLR